jgi:hypothetical protein
MARILMKTTVIHFDASIPITDVARALGALGYTISSTTTGELRVSKRRIRKPAEAKAEKK